VGRLKRGSDKQRVAEVFKVAAGLDETVFNQRPGPMRTRLQSLGDDPAVKLYVVVAGRKRLNTVPLLPFWVLERTCKRP
jgi:hypothetical protein